MRKPVFKADLKSYLLFSSNSVLKILRYSSKMHVLPGIILYPSDTCNLSCIMCDEGKETSNHLIMRMETFRKIIDEISHFKLKPKVHLSGLGEPLVYKHINEMMRYCNEKKISWSMTTNGYLLSAHAENIVRSGCSAINVSLHGLEKEHNYVTGTADAYERVIDGIRRLDQAKKTENRVNPLVAVNCVINTVNIDNLDMILDQMVKLPVNSITFQHLIFSETDADNVHMMKDKSRLKRLERFVYKAGTRINGVIINVFPKIRRGDLSAYYSPVADIFNHSCLLPWLGIRIYPNGDVGMCGKRFGNVNENELSEIINSHEAREFRNNVKTNKINYSECFRCCHRHY